MRSNLHLTLLLLFRCLLTSADKPNTLLLQAFVTYTGNGFRDGRSCQAGMQIAINSANSNASILPGYNLQVHFDDEAKGGQNVPTALYRFLDSNKTARAPIILGPFFSPGCTALGSIAHRENYVVIGTGCVDSMFTANRKRFPNLYRPMAPAIYDAMAQIKFVSQIINASRIGVVNSPAGAPGTIIQLYDQCQKNGIDVAAMEISLDVTDEIIQLFRKAEIRIMVILASDTSFILKFYCLAYRQGMTGGRYAFIVSRSTYITPTSLGDLMSQIPSGCNVSMVLEQIAITYAISVATTALPIPNSTYISTLGDTLNYFEAEFDRMTNRNRTLDYDMRHRCYDVALEAIVALNKAERKLQISNMTLSDFGARPVEVMRVVNQSVRDVTFRGLRYDKTMQYSTRAEFDFEDSFGFQWFSNAFNSFARYSVSGSESPWLNLDLTSFHVENIQPTIWYTPSRNPPKDRPSNFTDLATIPSAVANTILAVSCLLTIAQLVTIPAIIYLRTTLLISRMSLLAGCICCNISALLIGIDVVGNNMALEIASSALAWLGLATSRGIIVAFLIRLYKIAMQTFQSNKTVASIMTESTPNELEQSIRIPTAPIECTQNRLAKWLLASIAPVSIFVTAIIVTIWFATDNPSMRKLPFQDIYSNELDAHVHTDQFVFKSANLQVYWSTLVALHLAVLSVATCVGFAFGNVQPPPNVQIRRSDIQSFRTAAWNTTMLQIIIAMLTLLLYANEPMKRTAIATVNLLNSIIFGGTILTALRKTGTVDFGVIPASTYSDSRDSSTRFALPSGNHLVVPEYTNA